jgi:hypothetical protein
MSCAPSARGSCRGDDAADRQVGAPRVHAGQGEALLQVDRRQDLPQAVDRPRADAQVPQVVGRGVVFGDGGQEAEAQDGARRADHARETALHDLREEGIGLLVDVLDEAPLVAGLERVGAHEPLGEADGAQLETAWRARALPPIRA